MAIDERDPKRKEKVEHNLVNSSATTQAEFLRQFEQGSNAALAQPFGTLDWRKFGPLLLFTFAAIFFFERLTDLGAVTLNWKITFDVNLVAGFVVLIFGAISIVPQAIKKPQILRSQNTITSIILLAILIVFFLLHIINFGTFNYTQDKLDLNAVVGLVFVALIAGLAFRGSVLSVLVLASFFLWWGFSVRTHGVGPTATNFGFSTIADLFTSQKGGTLTARFFPPKWDYFARVIDPMFLTVQTAIASTVIGMIGALPLSVLAARNTSPHPAVYSIVRFLVNTVRAVPALILALLFIPFVGLGPAAGILGLGIHSITTLTKLYSEAFESVKPQPIEAMSAVGANGLKAFRWGVFPQVYPVVASNSIYIFESNTRDSTVVAFVGGGGIGFLIQQYTNLLDYATVSVLLIVLVLTVAVLDRFSAFVRSKII